jgi:hypothetical protein
LTSQSGRCAHLSRHSAGGDHQSRGRRGGSHQQEGHAGPPLSSRPTVNTWGMTSRRKRGRCFRRLRFGGLAVGCDDEAAGTAANFQAGCGRTAGVGTAPGAPALYRRLISYSRGGGGRRGHTGSSLSFSVRTAAGASQQRIGRPTSLTRGVLACMISLGTMCSVFPHSRRRRPRRRHV